MRLEVFLVAAGAVLLLSILVSKLAVKAGVPVLLLFLGIGMLAGSDGIGGIYFDDPWLAQSIGVVALAFILFSGGLDTDWASVRPVLRSGLSLATVGVTVTALMVGAFASAVLGFAPLEGMLLGAIISSTDAAAVFSVLRARSVALRGNVKPLLELESGSNDPMAVFLTIGLIFLLQQPDAGPLALLPIFVQQMGLGAVCGYSVGRVALWLVNRLRLEYEGLYPVLTTSLVLAAYGIAALVGGNGFLAVYMAGIIMGSANFIHKRSLLRFHDGIAWLMQIAMFLTLGLQVFPSRLPPVIPAGLLMAAFLIGVARPVSVLIALSLSKFTLREKALIAWVGLRGAAPIILATFPLLATLPKAEMIFNLVFFIVLTSVLLQGTTIISAAQWLRQYVPSPSRNASPLAYVMADGLITNDLYEFVVPAGAWATGKQLFDLHLPANTLIVLIGRQGEMLVPTGSTLIQTGDTLLILAPTATQAQVQRSLCRPAHDEQHPAR
jgi:cell volume regulation protein A